MYVLQLDLKLYFSPPMDENGPAILLTRTLELPFPPCKGHAITGRSIDPNPFPQGYRLENIAWDLDRQRFTAETTHVMCSYPLADIPHQIVYQVENGWKLGSYEDDFDNEDCCDIDDVDFDNTVEPEYDETLDEQLQTLPPRQRSKSFNKIFRAVIRVMCQVQNNLPTAYAMWKTGRLIPFEQVKKKETSTAQLFADASFEFEKMTFEQQWDWRKRICQTYPRLDKILADY